MGNFSEASTSKSRATEEILNTVADETGKMLVK